MRSDVSDDSHDSACSCGLCVLLLIPNPMQRVAFLSSSHTHRRTGTQSLDVLHADLSAHWVACSCWGRILQGRARMFCFFFLVGM